MTMHDQKTQTDQEQLEKNIEKFSKLFPLMDCDGNEGENAFRMVKSSMARITNLQEKITGERSELNFFSLLQKIEESGQGGDPEQLAQYEALLNEYKTENDVLKVNEEALLNENKRLRTQWKNSASDQSRLALEQQVLSLTSELTQAQELNKMVMDKMLMGNFYPGSPNLGSPSPVDSAALRKAKLIGVLGFSALFISVVMHQIDRLEYNTQKAPEHKVEQKDVRQDTRVNDAVLSVPHP